MIIAVDFDGTCVDHRYPDVGADVPGAVEWLRKFAAAGAKLILWTMRSDGPPQSDGNPLADAVEWFRSRGIPLFGVNQNPEQCGWTGSPKAYAHVYIDDLAFGCPLRDNVRAGGSRFVDWSIVGPGVMQLIEPRQR